MWSVIVEELVGFGDGRRWQLSRLEAVPEREAACRRARELAHRHVPEHPMSVRKRTVHRRDDDEFLVVVRGRTQDHHFRVGVWLEDEPLPG
ncbi:hypothetical protein ACQEVB_12555 [Pseudonocardia sp. CA-107938]|uniref:hypothetical protein n=1 Tax=Pseudonocardia sp. CA-107938 TaxID=3240021 RepID=UPI003D8F63E3